MNFQLAVSMTTRRARFGLMGVLFFVTPFLLPFPHSLAADNADRAIPVVNRIRDITINAANAASSKRRSIISTAIDRYVDVETLASRVLGKSYLEASAADKREFRSVLQEVLAGELSRRLRPGDRFDVTSAKSIGGSNVVVLTTVRRGNGETNRLDWKLRPCPAVAYCVYDLVYNGASLSAARRGT
jgi:ABC-type transporter MlaC component